MWYNTSIFIVITYGFCFFITAFTAVNPLVDTESFVHQILGDVQLGSEGGCVRLLTPYAESVANTEKKLACMMSAEQAAVVCEQAAKDIFRDNHHKITKGWCQDITDIREFLKHLLDDELSFQYLNFFLIFLYGDLSDIDNPNCRFLQSETKGIVDSLGKNLYLYHESCVFVTEDTTDISQLEHLFFLQQGARLVLIPKLLKQENGHLSSKMFLEKFIENLQIAYAIEEGKKKLESLSRGLHQKILDKLLAYVKEHWYTESLQRVFVAHKLLRRLESAVDAVYLGGEGVWSDKFIKILHDHCIQSCETIIPTQQMPFANYEELSVVIKQCLQEIKDLLIVIDDRDQVIKNIENKK